MLGNFCNDHANFLFKAKRAAEARHPPIQARSIHSPGLRQRHRDLCTGRAYSWELMDPKGHLCLNVLRAALFFRHALLFASDGVRRQMCRYRHSVSPTSSPQQVSPSASRARGVRLPARCEPPMDDAGQSRNGCRRLRDLRIRPSSLNVRPRQYEIFGGPVCQKRFACAPIKRVVSRVHVAPLAFCSRHKLVMTGLRFSNILRARPEGVPLPDAGVPFSSSPPGSSRPAFSTHLISQSTVRSAYSLRRHREEARPLHLLAERRWRALGTVADFADLPPDNEGQE